MHARFAWVVIQMQIDKRWRQEQGLRRQNDRSENWRKPSRMGRWRTSTSRTSSRPVRDGRLRKFRFLELYAGMGGLSRAVREVAGDLVEVLEPQDIYHECDILTDEDYKWAKGQVEEADWTHAAFPCESFTRARRSEHGAPVVVQDDAHPEGWATTHCPSEERVALGFRAHEKGKFFTMDNRRGSFAWEN